MVLGWTDDPSGWRALQAAAAEAQLRDASLSVVTINARPPAASAEGSSR